MVMGEVSLCRVKELPPTFARELRPALAKGDPAVLSGRVRHESCVTAFGWWSANLVERRCLLIVRGLRWPRTRKLSLERWQTVSRTFPPRYAPAHPALTAPRAPARLRAGRDLLHAPVIRRPTPFV